MVVVAQLVRAPDCGSGGRRFETDLPPSIKKGVNVKLALFYTLWGWMWSNSLFPLSFFGLGLLSYSLHNLIYIFNNILHLFIVYLNNFIYF